MKPKSAGEALYKSMFPNNQFDPYWAWDSNNMKMHHRVWERHAQDVLEYFGGAIHKGYWIALTMLVLLIIVLMLK